LEPEETIDLVKAVEGAPDGSEQFQVITVEAILGHLFRHCGKEIG
jgi:hypothetical protein